MEIIYFIIFLASLICLCLAVFGRFKRVNLVALGLALFVLVYVIQAGKAL